MRKLPNLIVATVVLTANLRADDQKESYSASKTVIVTDRAAPIMASENTLTTVPAGTVLLYTKENGDWLLVPRFGGWLKRENSVPIERSEEHFSRVIKMQPSAAAYQHRGAARLATGSFQGAIDDFTEALRLDGKASAPLVNRGLARTRLGDYTGAREDLTAALKRSPNDPFALLNRGLLGLSDGRLADARTDVESLLKGDPKSTEGLNLRGLIAFREGKLDEAIADFTQAIELYPQFSDAFLNRATVHVQKREYEQALKDYSSAQRFNPANVEAFNDAAWLLATCAEPAVRNPKLAVQLAEQVNSVVPEPEGNFLDTLAAAYASDDRFDEAVSTAEKAITLIPEADRAAVAGRLEKYRRKEKHVEIASGPEPSGEAPAGPGADTKSEPERTTAPEKSPEPAPQPE